MVSTNKSVDSAGHCRFRLPQNREEQTSGHWQPSEIKKEQRPREGDRRDRALTRNSRISRIQRLS
jgi:hypothetical protein